jgi:cytochrome c-type biogenesis protein CcmE
VPVVYRGTVPDLFRRGREVVVEGHVVEGTLRAVPGTLVTKCPSKYAPAKKA